MGYAVVDTETTGFIAESSDRIVEIAIVGLSDDGHQEFAWTTLLNPGRDLGPTSVHGIRAEDVLAAPTFAQAAPTLIRLLAGRVFVAHNASFDRRFVVSEFQRINVEVPLNRETTVCTQATARQLLPGVLSLADCCNQVGIVIDNAHEALSDAQATAQLTRYYLSQGAQRLWHDSIAANCESRWPYLEGEAIAPTLRGSGSLPDGGFLSLLPEITTGPDIDQSARSTYLAMLHSVLLDRVISRREVRQIVETAQTLGVSQRNAHDIHRDYIRQLIVASMADGHVSASEVADVERVAALLAVSPSEIPQLATAAEAQFQQQRTQTSLQPENDRLVNMDSPQPNAGSPTTTSTDMALQPGDRIVFTGEMSRPRAELTDMTIAAGYVPHPSVMKKVRLVVAADPDSLSGKARNAERLGIPIVTEDAFVKIIGELHDDPPSSITA